MHQDKFQQQLHHETLGKSSRLINAMEMEPTPPSALPHW